MTHGPTNIKYIEESKNQRKLTFKGKSVKDGFVLYRVVQNLTDTQLLPVVSNNLASFRIFKKKNCLQIVRYFVMETNLYVGFHTYIFLIKFKLNSDLCYLHDIKYRP